MEYEIAHAVSNGYHIPNRYEGRRASDYLRICLLQRDPAGWRTWEKSNLYPTPEAAVQACIPIMEYNEVRKCWCSCLLQPDSDCPHCYGPPNFTPTDPANLAAYKAARVASKLNDGGEV